MKDAFLRLFCNRKIGKYKGGDMNNFIVTLRKYDVKVTTVSRDVTFVVRNGTRFHFAMMYFADNNDTKGIMMLASLVYMCFMSVTADSEICDKIVDLVIDWSKKQLDKGEKLAKEALDEDNELDLREVKDAVTRGEKS